MSDLKDIGISYNDAPFRYICNQAETFKKSENELMFIHIRECEEIEKCKKEINAKTLLITNVNVPPITTNHSDCDVENYSYDYHIQNDGTIEELEQTAKMFVEELMK